MAEENQTQTVADLAIASIGEPQIIKTQDGREFLVTPHNMHSADVTPADKLDVFMPRFVAQHVKLQTVGSLIDYVNRFKNSDTVLFANIQSNTIQAIIDYHRMPGANLSADAKGGGTTDASARLNRHIATLTLPYSAEWETWNALSDKLTSHRAFASFLEENQIDVISPPGADLLELCRDLQVINNVSFSSSVRQGDYNKIAFAKDSDASAKGEVQLPNTITLSIPVYFGEQAVAVQAFIRRKIEEGSLTLGYRLTRVENIRQGEFHRIVDDVKSAVDCETLYGSAA